METYIKIKKAIENNAEILDIRELVDLKKIKINPNVEIEQRLKNFINDIKTPYRFLCGNTIVNIEYNTEGFSLEDCLNALFVNIENI